MPVRTLFLDQTGMLGGAELSLLDIARHHREASRVLLFADGPFAERLRLAGVDVDVLAAEKMLRKISRGGNILAELRALPGAVDLVGRVARAAGPFDVIYANSQKAFVVGAMAARLARKPILWHLRDILTFDHFSSSHRRLVVTIANHMNGRVIANSQATADAFCASGGRRDRVDVVYNGVDPAPYLAVTPEQVDAARRSLGVGEAPTVGVFSRFAHWKGQDVFVDAIAQLPGVHGVLVGKPLFGEDAYEQGVRAKTEMLGVADRVHFLGFRDDVPALMAVVDAIAVTSIAPEPFGRVIVEGMLARSPIIAARAGGPMEIIEDGVNGRLVPPGDASALAAAITDVLTDTAKTRDLVDSGFRTAFDRFSLPAMIEGVTAELRRVARREYGSSAWQRVPSPADELRGTIASAEPPAAS